MLKDLVFRSHGLCGGILEYQLKLIRLHDFDHEANNSLNVMHWFEEIEKFAPKMLETLGKDTVLQCLDNNHFEHKTKFCLHFVAALIRIYCKNVDVSGYGIPFLDQISALCSMDLGFGIDMEQIEDSYARIYNLSRRDSEFDHHMDPFNCYETFNSNVLFMFLYAAIKTNQKWIVHSVFGMADFNILQCTFPTNMEPMEIHRECFKLFVENSYEIGRDELPIDWLDETTLTQILDKQKDQKFLQPYYARDDDYEDSDYNEDFYSLRVIVNDQRLKHSITHPILSNEINKKFHKYSRIFYMEIFYLVSWALLLASMFCSIKVFCTFVLIQISIETCRVYIMKKLNIKTNWLPVISKLKFLASMVFDESSLHTLELKAKFYIFYAEQLRIFYSLNEYDKTKDKLLHVVALFVFQ